LRAGVHDSAFKAAAKTAKGRHMPSFSCTQFAGHDFVDDLID
jgi:hypothetical protein